MPKPAPYLLPLIVFAQFAGTSVWFAGNAVIGSFAGASAGATGSITAAVQFGFIGGTLTFALLRVADRFSAANVFFFSALCAAATNLLMLVWNDSLADLWILRCLTGFFLAGIYPVGMKIAADLFPQTLGRALGFLVGALVLGTAFPHFVKWQLRGLNGAGVLWWTSALAVAGGLLVLLLVPPSPPKSNSVFNFADTIRFFRNANFRAAAFGYFGHMWELYAFWAFVPFLIGWHNSQTGVRMDTAFWSFAVIAAGSAGCVAGGMLSRSLGSKKVAAFSLLISGGCCIALPFLLPAPDAVFIALLLLWGTTVVSDSPQFSALVAAAAPADNRGTALTIVTCIGFATTIVSIQLMNVLLTHVESYSCWLLAIGPVSGLWQLYRGSNRSGISPNEVTRKMT